MVEKKVYTSDIQCIVAKAYYTSGKSMAKICKEFKVNVSFVYQWAQRYKKDFIADRIVLLCNVRERLMMGASVGKFNTLIDVGIKIIIN